MSKPDLLCVSFTAEVGDIPGRTAGQRLFVLAWAKLRGGKETEFMTQQLTAKGWRVVEALDTKQVPSTDPSAEAPIQSALNEAREKGFAYIVHSRITT